MTAQSARQNAPRRAIAIRPPAPQPAAAARAALVAVALLLFPGLLTAPPAHSAQEASTATLIDLQAAMADYIERRSIDGEYLHFDAANGAVARYYPVGHHPKMFRFGDYYILCADFRTPDGAMINADFYVARRKERFVVFQAEIENREPVKRLIASGAAVRLQ